MIYAKTDQRRLAVLARPWPTGGGIAADPEGVHHRTTK